MWRIIRDKVDAGRTSETSPRPILVPAVQHKVCELCHFVLPQDELLLQEGIHGGNEGEQDVALQGV